MATAKTKIIKLKEEHLPEDLDKTKILYHVEGAGASPADGDFSDEVIIEILTGPSYASLFTVDVGYDFNEDGELGTDEIKLTLKITIYDIDSGTPLSARINAPTESLYPIKADEHVEITGRFNYKLQNPAEAPEDLKYQLIYTTGSDQIYQTGAGPEFTHTYVSDEAGDFIIKWYCDINGNNDDDFGENFLDSEEFECVELKNYNLNLWLNQTDFDGYQEVFEQQVKKSYELVLKRDSADDWRACIKITPTIKKYSISAVYYITTMGQHNTLGETIGETGFYVFQSYNNVVVPKKDFAAFTYKWNSWVADRGEFLSAPVLFIHEVGHGMGISHNESSSKNVMYPKNLTTMKELTKSQRNDFEDGP